MAPILSGSKRQTNLPTQHRTALGETMVGLGRFELPTSRLSSARSNQLSYRPLSVHPCEERETKTAVPRVFFIEPGRYRSWLRYSNESESAGDLRRSRHLLAHP